MRVRQKASVAVIALAFGSWSVLGAGCGGSDSETTSDAGVSADGSAGDGSDRDASSGDAGADAHPCTNGDPSLDQDGDGYTGAQGDCNDCDPLVNPGAVDVDHSVDGGAPSYTDDDCDGTAGNDLASCGEGLALDDVSADDAVKAMELCRRANATTRSWGVETDGYVRANGAAFATPGLQVGIQPSFGPNVSTRSGGTMLLLSTGAARTPSQAGACGSDACKPNATGTAPAGFPQHAATCIAITSIADDIALSVKLRVPTNAVGYSFDTAFYSFGFLRSACSLFNDQTVVLVSPAPAGAATGGNVLFDAAGKLISDDTLLLTSCDASTMVHYASNCSGTCPSAPSPYCPLGLALLVGTGFDLYGESPTAGGATPWLRTAVPVTPGSEITLQFTIWDSSDENEDSSVLFDHFHWITAGTVTTSTTVAP